ncbi:tail host specificity protein J [Rhizobium phage RHph_Y1_11]|nr:tail host specificity protein J [Rhizobium phage RHph_Y1_11]
MNELVRTKGLNIVASGGGGGKGGKTKDDSNTLRSNATAQLLYLIGEGRMQGIVGGRKNVILDETRIDSASGSTNIKGVTVYERFGLPTQDPIPNFNGVANEISVGAKVSASTPIVRSLTDSDYTSCAVTIRLPALVKSTDKGFKKSSVSFRIEVRANGGTYQNLLGDITITGKCIAPYDVQYIMKLPVATSGNSYPWDIRVTRLTEDSTSDKLQNETYFASMTGIIDVTLQYPDSALLGLLFDAKEFDGGVPAVSAICDGVWIDVPSNYNPVTRVYSGEWDGTFVKAFSDNPAWVYWDMATHNRYGLGKLLDKQAVDKWTLYAIAQVCDQMVSDGYGGQEPRFTVNAYIVKASEAYEMMQMIASAFRGMSFWGSGALTATQDTLADPKVLVTKSNTLADGFSYSSSALTARHTVVHVKYRDKKDDYQPAMEVVRDADGMLRYGERIKEIDGFGITSRAQARRLGLWVLYTELYETSVVSYQAGLDHTMRRPGDIISVLDPEIANADVGGRLATGTSVGTLVLDRQVTIEAGKTYTAHVTLADGTLEERGVTNAPGDTTTLTLASDLPSAPATQAQWILASNTLVPKPYRIVSILERQKATYEVSALEIYHNKYALIDSDLVLDDPPYQQPLIPDPPTNLTAQEIFFYANGVPTSQLLFSWTPAATQVAPLFRIEIDVPGADNEIVVDRFSGISFTVPNSEPGFYTIRLYAQNISGTAKSEVRTLTVNAEAVNAADLIVVENIRIVGESGHEFYSRDVEIAWDNVIPSGNTTNLLYKRNRVVVSDMTDPLTPVVLRVDYTTSTSYIYSYAMNQEDAGTAVRDLQFSVLAEDVMGRQGAEADFLASNPPPAAPSVTVTGSVGGIYVDTVFPQLKDVQGQVVHVSETEVFTPDGTTLAYSGASSFTFVLKEPGDYWVKVALYDDFGGELNFTSSIGVSVASTDIDTVPPAVPTGLAVNSVLRPDGLVDVTYTWDANTELDLFGYIIQIKEGAGEYLQFLAPGNTYTTTVGPNVELTAAVLAYDTTGNRSNYSDPPLVYTTVKDETPPAKPTGLLAAAGLAAIWLNWNQNTETDLHHYEVWENDEDVFGTATLIMRTSATAASRSGLPLDTERWYWIVAVDTSGNASVPSDSISGVTGSVPDGAVYSVIGITFTPNDGATNRLGWTSGNIAYGPPGEDPTVSAISAGTADWTTGTLYVYYVEGATTLATATTIGSVYLNSGHLLGVYKGSLNFQLVSGQALIDGNTIIAGTIGADQLIATEAVITGTAQIADAIITNAKISDLSAAKLTAGTALAGSITVAGTALSTIQGQAADPAPQINAGSTLIDPGKILISGATKLSDWRNGTDNTKIEGGSIAANTITANKLTIGQRGVRLENIQFSYDKDTQVVSWTAGTLRYMSTNATTGVVEQRGLIVNSGTATWTSGRLYIYWQKPSTDPAQSSTISFASSNVIATANAADTIVFASYDGGTKFNSEYGQTIIDGSTIKTGTITADQIQVGSLTGDLIAAETITGDNIAAGSITAKHLIIGDFSNIVPNGDYTDTDASAYWTMAGDPGSISIITNPAVARTGPNYLRLVKNDVANNTWATTDYVQVTAGDALSWSTAIKGNVAATGGAYLQIYWYDAAKVAITPDHSDLMADKPLSTSWVAYNGSITVPTGAAFAVFLIMSYTTNTTAVWLEWDRIIIRRSQSVVIADGSITAIKLNVSTLSSITANIGTVTAGVLQSTDGKVQFDLTNKRILMADNT